MPYNKRPSNSYRVNRSSITGRFVTEQQVKKNPRTTEQERIKKK